MNSLTTDTVIQYVNNRPEWIYHSHLYVVAVETTVKQLTPIKRSHIKFSNMFNFLHTAQLSWNHVHLDVIVEDRVATAIHSSSQAIFYLKKNRAK